MLLDIVYRLAKGMPLTLDLGCTNCKKKTRHYFDSFEQGLLYECILCDTIQSVDESQFKISKDVEDLEF